MEAVSEVINVLIITIIGICIVFGVFLYKHANEYNKTKSR